MDKSIQIIQEEIIKLHDEMEKTTKGSALYRGKHLAATILKNVLGQLKGADDGSH